MEKPTLAIVVPCYNEQDMLESTAKRLVELTRELVSKEKINDSSFLYLVDDGSRDRTWEIIENLNRENPAKVRGLKLTRNFGNQNALLAGFLNVRKFDPDCVITIDADLQQDENAIEQFVEKFQQGADIVSGVRNNRTTDSFFKKHTALMFYKLMNLMGAKITPNHSDYRLISKKVLNILPEYQEFNLFLRGIFYELGLKTEYVKFNVKPRFIGTSRYKTRDLMALALNGITSFSVVPLRLVGAFGIIMALLSFGMGLEVIYEKYIAKSVIPGWTTIIVAICFIGGVQIFCIGIIGEYLGQVYKEVKARPRFLKDIELE